MLSQKGIIIFSPECMAEGTIPKADMQTMLDPVTCFIFHGRFFKLTMGTFRGFCKFSALAHYTKMSSTIFNGTSAFMMLALGQVTNAFTSKKNKIDCISSCVVLRK